LRRQYLQFRFAQLDSRQPGQVCHVFSGECHLSNLLDRWVRLILVREFLQAAADQRLGVLLLSSSASRVSMAETTETRAGFMATRAAYFLAVRSITTTRSSSSRSRESGSKESPRLRSGAGTIPPIPHRCASASDGSPPVLTWQSSS
jgi:hypothetical protein